MHIFFLIRNMRIENFGPLGFSYDFVLQCTWKKCITIHLLLDNIRPRIRYRKMQILWRFQGASPLDLHQDSTIELLGACSARIHSNVLRNDRRPLHVVPMTWYASQTKRQKMYDWGGGGAPLIGLPPHQLLSHHATDANCKKLDRLVRKGCCDCLAQDSHNLPCMYPSRVLAEGVQPDVFPVERRHWNFPTKLLNWYWAKF